MVHVDDFVGQALQLSAAWPFHDDLDTRFPTLLPPCFNPEEVDTHLVLAELPDPPKRPTPLSIQATPLCPELSSHPPLYHQGIQKLPK
jgi:hypothetical protein